MHMSPSAQQTLLQMFCKNNRLIQGIVAPASAQTIAHVEAPFLLFLELLDPSGVSSSTNPVDGLLVTLLGRLHNTVAGSLVLLSTGQFQQAEILSRTVMESALSFQYIMAEQSGHRLAHYFSNYVREEREQLRKWKNEIDGVTDAWRLNHEHRILDKQASLAGYEAFIEQFAATLPSLSKGSKTWPSLYDICVALGRAVEYRTVHMAMCSQVHHDAEDILNDFMIGSTEDYEHRSLELARETGNFSIFLVLCGLRYYIECLSQLGSRYEMPTVVAQSNQSLEFIATLAAAVAGSGFVNAKFDEFLPGNI